MYFLKKQHITVMSYFSDSSATLALDLICLSILLDTKALLTTHLISDRTLDSRYLKRLLNIQGQIKCIYLKYLLDKNVWNFLFRYSLLTMIQSVAA